MGEQKYKADAGKLHPRLLIYGMPRALQVIAATLTYGEQKYAAHSWKNVEAERYEDAKIRHQLAYAEDRLSKDEESGILHTAHEIINALFLLEMDLAEMPDNEFKSMLKFNPPHLAHKIPQITQPVQQVEASTVPPFQLGNKENQRTCSSCLYRFSPTCDDCSTSVDHSMWEKDNTYYARLLGIEKAKQDPSKYLGRKPSYTRRQLSDVLILIDKGLGISDIHRKLGISRQAILRIKQDRKAASDALERWENK